MKRRSELSEETFASFVSNLGLSFSENVVLSFCLFFSQNKLLSGFSKKYLKSKVKDFRNTAVLLELPDSIRGGLINIFNSDEDLKLLWLTQDLKSVENIGDSANFMSSRRNVSIASILEDYGCQCSSNGDAFRKALHSTGQRIDEEQVASILILMLPKGSNTESIQWNLEVVAEVLNAECRGLNWGNLVKALDNPKLSIRSETDFQILSRMIVRISGSTIPVNALLSSMWSNRAAQFAILTLASGASRNIVDFSTLISHDQLIPGEGVNTPPNLSWVCLPLYLRMLELASNGFAMDVLEVMTKAAALFPEYVLCSLAQVHDTTGIKAELLQRLLPLFTGLPGSKPSSLLVIRRLFAINVDVLLRLCCVGLKRCSKLSEVVGIDNIVKALGPQNSRRIDSEGAIDELLSLWCVRADRQEINLDERLSAVLELNPKHARLMASYAKLHSEGMRPRPSQQNDALMSVESFSSIVRAIQPYSQLIPPEEMKNLISIYSQCHGSHPMSTISGSTGSGGPPSASAIQSSRDFDNALEPRTESEEIEGIANAYFQKIYTTDISIMDVVLLLRQFKTSNDKREQEIFRCMIHNLFDEYRFFHKYPEKELVITGRLFGALVQHQLVASITLGIALRYVLEALRKDPDLGDGNDKMFRFGLIALDQFRARLCEWPQFCSHLIQIPHFSRHNPELFQEAQRALSNPQSSLPASSQTQFLGGSYEQSNLLTPQGGNFSFPGSSQPVSANFGGSAANQLPLFQPSSHLMQQVNNNFIPELANPVPTSKTQLESNPVRTIEPRLSEIERMVAVNKPLSESSVPSDTARDQIHFIINNIAKNNLETKASEMKELLRPEFYGWFASYLVEKRVSSQPNLHPLYLAMLDLVDSSELLKLVLDSTYYNITKFLSSPNITTSSNERSVLRYFGMWLGQLTLAKNKPLLHKRLNMKSLLFWGYETGRLIAVCSFVAKVLEAVKDSKVFRPPNPWLMAILGVLKELYEIEDLKLNIKFEVQVLCKNINIKLEDIPKTIILSQCKTPVRDNRNPDFSAKAASSNVNSSVPSVAVPIQGQPATQAPEPIPPVDTPPVSEPIPSTTQTQNYDNVLQQISNSIVVNPGITYFVANPGQRRLVAAAVERGIREIIQSAVERSSLIACSTTKQLLLKDFCCEGGEKALSSAAHSMVSSLTSSLAMVTCKEPLRISIGNHLRALLATVISDQTMIEQIVQVCSNDNLELGSNLIEKVAVEKAIREIDELLSSAYSLRQHSKDPKSFSDSAVTFPSKTATAEILDALKPQQGGLLGVQLSLYENFNKSKSGSLLEGKSVPEGKPMPPLAAGSAATLSMSQALDAYQIVYTRLENSLKVLQGQLQGREVTLSMLGEHEVVQLLKDIILVTQRTQLNVRNETAMTFSETIFSRMFDGLAQPDPLRLEVSVSLLEAIKEACGGSKTFNPDIISWLGKHAASVNNDELSRKVYRHILILLLRAKLIRSQELDVYFTIHIDSGRNLFWLELALSFIKQCLVENLCSVYEYGNTLEMISKLRPSNVLLKRPLQKWLSEIKTIATAHEERTAASAPVAPPTTPQREIISKEHVTVLMERWIRIWNTVNDQVFGQFLQLMHQCGVLKTEEAADRFFKISTEICIEASQKSLQNSNGADSLTPNYTFVDAISKLFLLLIRLADKETSDIHVRANLLNRILSAVVRAIVEDHDNKKATKILFDQRPYYRLLSNISSDMGIPDSKQDVNQSNFPLLTAFAQSYLALQPAIVPGFTFAWLQLVSKRSFMPYLMRNQKGGWPIMHRLVSMMLLFLQPFLKVGYLYDPIRKIYKGLLKVLLVMLHDFPEFLCDFHLSFCDLIPLNCVQLRNLILSAFPRTMRLPDPFTPNLKVDFLPEISQPPRILVDFLVPLNQLRSLLDNYLGQSQPVDFPQKLLAVFNGGASATTNTMLTSLTMYIGSVCVSNSPKRTNALVAGMEIFKHLAGNLECENRYVFLNAIANQLRYPNSHTTYFSNVVLTLFGETDNEFLQEQITRVLLERLIVHRPHPWGLLITFIELIKNPRYSFWRRNFTHSAPEIERVFESIARSCIGPLAPTVISQQLSQS